MRLTALNQHDSARQVEVWQWGLKAPFGLDDGLIPGVLANLVVYTAVAAATASRYPRRRQPALVLQGEPA